MRQVVPCCKERGMSAAHTLQACLLSRLSSTHCPRQGPVQLQQVLVVAGKHWGSRACQCSRVASAVLLLGWLSSAADQVAAGAAEDGRCRQAVCPWLVYPCIPAHAAQSVPSPRTASRLCKPMFQEFVEVQHTRSIRLPMNIRKLI